MELESPNPTSNKLLVPKEFEERLGKTPTRRLKWKNQKETNSQMKN